MYGAHWRSLPPYASSPAQPALRDRTAVARGPVRPRRETAQLLSVPAPADADQVLDEAFAANPKSAELPQAKGEMLLSRGDVGGAVQLFDEALKIDPNYLPARLSRAAVNLEQGNFAAADADLDPILKDNPKNFRANYLRAVELAKQQRYAAAEQIFDRISPEFSTFWTGYYHQGETKFVLGKFAEAETILGKSLAQVPDPRAVRLVATAALQQHGAPRAIDYLRSLVDRLPADPATLTLLGDAYKADGKPELALQQFEKAAALDPENPTIKTSGAISEINAGQSQQGLATLQQVFASEAGAAIAGPT